MSVFEHLQGTMNSHGARLARSPAAPAGGHGVAGQFRAAAKRGPRITTPGTEAPEAATQRPTDRRTHTTRRPPDAHRTPDGPQATRRHDSGPETQHPTEPETTEPDDHDRPKEPRRTSPHQNPEHPTNTKTTAHAPRRHAHCPPVQWTRRTRNRRGQRNTETSGDLARGMSVTPLDQGTKWADAGGGRQKRKTVMGRPWFWPFLARAGPGCRRPARHNRGARSPARIRGDGGRSRPPGGPCGGRLRGGATPRPRSSAAAAERPTNHPPTGRRYPGVFYCRPSRGRSPRGGSQGSLV